MKKELNLESVKEHFDLLKRVLSAQSVPLTKLATELSIKSTTLLKFIDGTAPLIQTKEMTVGKKKVLSVTQVYLQKDQVPLTEEWLNKKIKDNEKTLKLSHYDNYGHISGHYIEPSKDTALKYLNTLDKIKTIQERFNLPKASYYIGGFGDSARISPEGGFQISKNQRQTLKNEGWTFIDEKEIND